MEDHTPVEDYSTQKHSILRHDGQLECSFNMQLSSLSESNRAIESDHIHQSFKLSQGHSGNDCCKHKDTNHTQVQCIDSNSGSNKELELTGDLTQQISEPGDLSSSSSDVHKELGLAEKTRKRKLIEESGEDNGSASKRMKAQEEPSSYETSTLDVQGLIITKDFIPIHYSNTEATLLSPSSSLEGRNSGKDLPYFTIPNWNVSNEDLVYTELAHGNTLSLPQFQLDPQDQDKSIGLWGEHLVFDYLRRQKEENASIQSVIWANAEGEKGLPFDFEIVLKTSDADKTSSIFVEVKTTLSWDKEVFHISSKQMEFALVQKDQYEIYRVFGAGSSNAKLVRIQNLSERLRKKQIQLFMVI
uniref:Protein NO VEIN C-terminal domain-containing protein n=1 Tax=Biomphalaria glabrata TaxID=6526 RepID=A0A2C9LHE0_BIOGL